MDIDLNFIEVFKFILISPLEFNSCFAFYIILGTCEQ